MAINKIVDKVSPLAKNYYVKDEELEKFHIDIFDNLNRLVKSINGIIDKMNEIIDEVNKGG